MAGEADVENDPSIVDRFELLSPDEVAERSRHARELYIALLDQRSGYRIPDDLMAKWWKYADA